MQTPETDAGAREKREELADAIARHAPPVGGRRTDVGPLTLVRYDRPTAPLHLRQGVALWVVAQGRKELVLADEPFAHGPDECLLISFDLPVITRVVEASPGRPFLGFALDLEPAEVAATVVAHDLEVSPPECPGVGRGVSVRPVTRALLDACVRLVRLLDAPADIAALAPLVLEEVRYRLLTGPHGALARQVARADPRLHTVARAIEWLGAHYAEPYALATLTREVGMSASALHRHFRAVTAMTPLQYQKELRLREARALMLSGGLTAAAAGHRVGYASPSQFSREYRRLFGGPPAQDAARLQSTERAPAM